MKLIISCHRKRQIISSRLFSDRSLSGTNVFIIKPLQFPEKTRIYSCTTPSEFSNRLQQMEPWAGPCRLPAISCFICRVRGSETTGERLPGASGGPLWPPGFQCPRSPCLGAGEKSKSNQLEERQGAGKDSRGYSSTPRALRLFQPQLCPQPPGTHSATSEWGCLSQQAQQKGSGFHTG